MSTIDNNSKPIPTPHAFEVVPRKLPPPPYKRSSEGIDPEIELESRKRPAVISGLVVIIVVLVLGSAVLHFYMIRQRRRRAKAKIKGIGNAPPFTKLRSRFSPDLEAQAHAHARSQTRMAPGGRHVVLTTEVAREFCNFSGPSLSAGQTKMRAVSVTEKTGNSVLREHRRLSPLLPLPAPAVPDSRKHSATSHPRDSVLCKTMKQFPWSDAGKLKCATANASNARKPYRKPCPDLPATSSSTIPIDMRTRGLSTLRPSKVEAGADASYPHWLSPHLSAIREHAKKGQWSMYRPRPQLGCVKASPTPAATPNSVAGIPEILVTPPSEDRHAEANTTKASSSTDEDEDGEVDMSLDSVYSEDSFDGIFSAYTGNPDGTAGGLTGDASLGSCGSLDLSSLDLDFDSPVLETPPMHAQFPLLSGVRAGSSSGSGSSLKYYFPSLPCVNPQAYLQVPTPSWGGVEDDAEDMELDVEAVRVNVAVKGHEHEKERRSVKPACALQQDALQQEPVAAAATTKTVLLMTPRGATHRRSKGVGGSISIGLGLNLATRLRGEPVQARSPVENIDIENGGANNILSRLHMDAVQPVQRTDAASGCVRPESVTSNIGVDRYVPAQTTGWGPSSSSVLSTVPEENAYSALSAGFMLSGFSFLDDVAF